MQSVAALFAGGNGYGTDQNLAPPVAFTTETLCRFAVPPLAKHRAPSSNGAVSEY